MAVGYLSLNYVLGRVPWLFLVDILHGCCFQRKFEDPESIEGKLICNISTMLQADYIEIDMLRFYVAC